MLRLVAIFVVIALLAAAATWFADRPGEITLTWLDYEIRTSLMFAGAMLIAALALLAIAWSVLRAIIGAPGTITAFFRDRRRERGLDALTKGVVAAGAGDAVAAKRYASLAGRFLGDAPLARLLQAQAAQLSGDEVTVKRVFDTMLQAPETEVLGLRGLFVQARQDGDQTRARALAERALALNPHLSWAALAVLAMQSADGDWESAERTIEECKRHKLFEPREAARKVAVVLTARAMAIEDTQPQVALGFAERAHKLAPELAPAAIVAGRLLAAMDQTRKANRVLEKTWALSPHPELAELYGGVLSGRSPRERLKRVKALVRKSPAEYEGPIAIAHAALAAFEWDEAHEALEPLLDDFPSARVCGLMAELEQGANADEGRVREWLARAMHAPRDPVWTADGFVSDTWKPFSPVTGELDVFVWRVPVEGIALPDKSGVQHASAVPAIADGSAEQSGSREESAKESTGDTAPPPAHDAEAGHEGDSVRSEPAKADDTDDGSGDDVAGSGEDTPAAKPRIFVPPRAPDDPGPDPRDEEPGGNWFQGLFAR